MDTSGICYNNLEDEFLKEKDELEQIDKILNTLQYFPSDYSTHFLNTKRKQDLPPNSTHSKEKEIEKLKLEDFSILDESSVEYEYSPKKAIPSIVVTNVRNSLSRREIIRKQNANLKSESRNRRMVGILQDTLLKFQKEANERKDQDLKRLQVEQKVEADAERKKKEMLRQKEKLLLERREKQLHLRCLNKMIDIAKSYEMWENNQKHLLNYIATKVKPQIYFLPASHTSSTRLKHEKSKLDILNIIENRKLLFTDELAKIKRSYHLLKD